jgi:N-acetylglucosaminyldiphosphoundecaprenol N-acetyl-beta-D-mannosaminyltransferase
MSYNSFMLKIDIAGLKVDAITKKLLLDGITSRIKSGQKTFVITPYSEFLYHGFQDPKLLEIFNQADFSVADGIGLFWAKRFLDIPLTAKSFWGKVFQAAWQIKYSLAAIIFYPRWIKSALPEKIVGADLIWDLAKLAADNNLSVYLLGGFGDTPQLAAEKIQKTNSNGRQILFSGKNPGDPTVIDDINRAQPDLLFVAYGPIKQEKWIAENLPKLNVKLAIGLGGSFDYIAGKKSAPPKFIRYCGLEWLWRLFTQPYRAKRIFHATFGLAWGLWHYKVFKSLPLRHNVAIVILNQKNEILVCQRDPKNFYVDIISNEETLKRQNYWQLPQGGIDSEEGLVEAAKREAKEETGIKNLQLVKISDRTNTYIWNNARRKFWHNRRHRNIGQVQNVCYFKFLGPDSEIKIDNDEFIGYQWVKINDLDKIAHPERANLIKIVQEDLKDLA